MDRSVTISVLLGRMIMAVKFVVLVLVTVRVVIGLLLIALVAKRVSW